MPRWARRLTPETGNVQRGVLVAVMVRATFATGPSPDRKPNSPLRTAVAAADRTGLRGIGFINLGVGYPCVIAFVSEVVAQHIHRFLAGDRLLQLTGECEPPVMRR